MARHEKDRHLPVFFLFLRKKTARSCEERAGDGERGERSRGLFPAKMQHQPDAQPHQRGADPPQPQAGEGEDAENDLLDCKFF